MKKLFLAAALVVLMGQGCAFNSRREMAPPPANVKVETETTIDTSVGTPVITTSPSPTPSPEPTPKPTPTPTPAPSPTPTPTPTPAPAPQPKTVNVSISNFAFASASITVNKGDKVVFKNNDQMTHTVTSDAGKFDGSVSTGQTFTLDTSNLAPGNYPYHCKPHPFMTGTIIVK